MSVGDTPPEQGQAGGMTVAPSAYTPPLVPGHAREFLRLARDTARRLDADAVTALAGRLAEVRSRGGRVFVLGVGGSAANASHAVNDFRKLCALEAYAPTDNVAELTARTNDEGWESTFVNWLRTSRLSERDAVLVLSVGGGDRERGLSANLVHALDEARARGAAVLGVVGRDGGYAARVADVVVVIPTVEPSLVTPLAESFQSLVLHCLVSDPQLAVECATWERVDAASALAADGSPTDPLRR